MQIVSGFFRVLICWAVPAYVWWAIVAENACTEGHPEAEWGPISGCTSTILAEDPTMKEG